MWIRSANKAVLLNFTGVGLKETPVYYEKHPDESIKVMSTDSEGWYLGQYKTIKRAIEILDDIQFTVMKSKNNCVYQMPEE